MQTIKDILRIHGFESVDEMTYDDHIKLEVDGFMPLGIEKVGDNRLSVVHYYTQMDDLMSDPEIVFDVSGERWLPVEYTQHPHIYQHNEAGLQNVQTFSKQWSKNLKTQGFVEAARQAASASTPEVTA